MRSYTKKMVCHVPTQMQRGFSVLTETEGFSVLTETEGLTPGGVASLLHIKQMRYIKHKLNLHIKQSRVAEQSRAEADGAGVGLARTGGLTWTGVLARLGQAASAAE